MQWLDNVTSIQAANPGCLLEDFVRWYSPRDWIQEDADKDNSTPGITETGSSAQCPPQNSETRDLKSNTTLTEGEESGQAGQDAQSMTAPRRDTDILVVGEEVEAVGGDQATSSPMADQG